MGGIEYVYWPGTTTRLTPWMLYCLQRLDEDLRKFFDVHLTLDSSDVQRGIRTYEEQVELFTSRYRKQAVGSGPYGDVRWWGSARWVRHSGLGTVAQPGKSNHEIQGTSAAIDLADSGDAGIGTMGSNRSNWLRANAGKYGLEPEGFSFNEAWHYRVPGIFRVPPTPPPAPTIPEEFSMAEAIVSAPNGVVVHLRSGGKTNFESAPQYNTFRDQVAFLRNAGATDIMALPPLEEVPKVSWETFNFLCRYIGAPLK